MRLNVNRSGVKLFFITFAVVGRRKVLSRLVDETSRPELLPLGEAVKAALLAIHRVWPAVGISDFVVMPDHVHFLMVVDYARDGGFNPLWATHRLLDAIEAAWDARGQAPEPSQMPDMVEALRTAVERGRQVAADLRCGAGLPQPGRGLSKPGFGASPGFGLSKPGFGAARPGPSIILVHRGRGVAGFGASPGRGLSQLGFGAARPGHPVIFERSPWLDLAFDPRQLKATRHYIRLNPARALWKACQPYRSHSQPYRCGNKTG